MRTTSMALVVCLLGQLAFFGPLKLPLPWQQQSGANWAPVLGRDQAVSEISQG